MAQTITQSPQVTVLMPVHNGQPFLAEAIESILTQNFRDFELLIINDGSTDDSLACIRSYRDTRITLVDHDKKIGLVKSLNEGLRLARAPLVARMDADDVSDPSRLKKQVNFLKDHPKIVLVGTAMRVIDRRGMTVGRPPILTDDQQIHLALLVTNTFPHGSVMFRKEAVLACGGYRQEAYLVEDYDLWTRLAKVGELANLPEALYAWRINPSGETLSKNRHHRQNLAQVIDRQWIDYPPQDPLPRSAWPALWSRQVLAKARPATRQLLAELHIHFMKVYLVKGRYKIAWQHFWSALAISPQSWLNYAYVLGFILPKKLFFNLEAWGFEVRSRQRGW